MTVHQTVILKQHLPDRLGAYLWHNAPESREPANALSATTMRRTNNKA